MNNQDEPIYLLMDSKQLKQLNNALTVGTENHLHHFTGYYFSQNKIHKHCTIFHSLFSCFCKIYPFKSLNLLPIHIFVDKLPCVVNYASTLLQKYSVFSPVFTAFCFKRAEPGGSGTEKGTIATLCYHKKLSLKLHADFNTLKSEHTPNEGVGGFFCHQIVR